MQAALTVASAIHCQSGHAACPSDAKSHLKGASLDRLELVCSLGAFHKPQYFKKSLGLPAVQLVCSLQQGPTSIAPACAHYQGVYTACQAEVVKWAASLGGTAAFVQPAQWHSVAGLYHTAQSQSAHGCLITPCAVCNRAWTIPSSSPNVYLSRCQGGHSACQAVQRGCRGMPA